MENTNTGLGGGVGGTTGGFNLTAPAAAATTTTGTVGGGITFGLGLGGTAAAPATASGFSLTAPATASGFSLPTPATASGFSLPTTTTTPAPTLLGGGGTTLSLSSTPILSSTPVSVASTISSAGVKSITTAVAAEAPKVPAISFRQIQDQSNKWTCELDEQEKLFIGHATRVNAWDKVLMVNGEKITNLNEVLDNIRGEHERLESTLEYIKGQQAEFKNLIDPLESTLPQQQIFEMERENVYNMAESIDSELTQMTEDLKEVILNINDANSSHDKQNPVAQTSEIEECIICADSDSDSESDISTVSESSNV